MKTVRLLAACLTLLTLSYETLPAKEKEVKSSIRPTGKVKKENLPTLAKISMAEALKAAMAAAPGSVLKAELEIEDGNLMYSFDIVTDQKTVLEVEVDAGNGKVLDVDKD